jgi:hypothetical protein
MKKLTLLATAILVFSVSTVWAGSEPNTVEEILTIPATTLTSPDNNPGTEPDELIIDDGSETVNNQDTEKPEN